MWPTSGRAAALGAGGDQKDGDTRLTCSAEESHLDSTAPRESGPQCRLWPPGEGRLAGLDWFTATRLNVTTWSLQSGLELLQRSYFSILDLSA